MRASVLVSLSAPFVSLSVSFSFLKKALGPFLQMTRINLSDCASGHPNWRTDLKLCPRSYSLAAQRLNLLMIIRDTHVRSDRTLRLTFTALLAAKLRVSRSRAGEDGKYED
jgi:hypothetical protein